MKVLHLSSNDLLGGAAKACLALNRALNNAGIDSSVLVQKKAGNEKKIYSISDSIYKKYKARFREGVEFFFNKYFVVENKDRFSPAIIGHRFNNKSVLRDSDIFHLHWINEGFLSLSSFKYLLRLNKPVVWTLHDMWAFTGGCHYTGECIKYLDHCGNCPILKNTGPDDMSFALFKKKTDLFSKHKINIVTCSKWLASEAQRSRILSAQKIIPIPNTVDESRFFFVDRYAARDKLGLPKDKKLLLFASMTVNDERKGFRYLSEALSHMYENYSSLRNELEILIIGRMEENLKSRLLFPVISFGRISDDEKLNNIYNSADVFVAPSIQDNLPNTVMESMVCGLPSVGFNIGGIPDMIDHMQNGFIVEDISGRLLAEGIYWCIHDKDINEKLGQKCIEKYHDNFKPSIIAEKYISLYKSLV